VEMKNPIQTQIDGHKDRIRALEKLLRLEKRSTELVHEILGEESV
jgi:hypothetical protein